MKVLLACADIFSVVGGGQSFFADVVKANPSVSFTYFATKPVDPGKLPPNVEAAPLSVASRAMSKDFRLDRALAYEGSSLAGAEGDILPLLDMAHSVAGRRFDAVEIPDFLPFAALLPPLMAAAGAEVDRVVLSMHGTLTHALAGNWAPDATFDLARLRTFEAALHRSADLRYGIGRPYLEEWRERTGFEGHLLDVATVFDLPAFAARRRRAGAEWSGGVTPDIVYVGRHDRCKGPDLFVDFVGSLPRGSFAEAWLVGPSVELAGHGSRPALERMAERRRLDLRFDRLARGDLLRSYASRPWYLFLPSRKDTFNLAALEAILSACPTAVSATTGVSDYLRQALPDLPCLHVDPEDLGESRADVLGQLASYGRSRRALADGLAQATPRPFGSRLDEIWRRPAVGDAETRAAMEELAADVLNELDRAAKGAHGRRLQASFAKDLDRSLGGLDPGLSLLLKEAPSQASRLEELRRAVEAETGGVLAVSDGRLATLANEIGPFTFSANRAGLYELLAGLEEARGNDLLVATYLIRSMRLTGRASPGRLAKAKGILAKAGYGEEAEVLGWLHGPEADRASARRYLDAARDRFRAPPTGDVEAVDDRRRIEAPKASIIVSMYRAADKLPAFLRGLSRLTPRTRAACEVILVDSHSPDGTREAAARELAKLEAEGRRLDALYLRTSVRETIQRAWNRGVAASRADYVAFLGVDEMNRADAFDVLIDELDRDPNLDWVQGTALVTDVDANGAFLRDDMAYDRRFDTPLVQLLDTCFLGYVGALYRKRLHDRVGYYDDRFRGAGDTEFKNRALPVMRARTLPECLGFFLNYPEERVTASAGVEIEDIRAWYLHRSAAGMGYQFDGRPLADAAALAATCLSYRKTYLDQDSTDLELAAALHDHMASRAPGEVSLVAQACVRAALDGYRDLDDLDAIAGRQAGLARDARVRRAVEAAAGRIGGAGRLLRSQGWTGSFGFRNDNRSHQHFNIWPSALARAGARRDASDERRAAPARFLASPALTFTVAVPGDRADLSCRIDGHEAPASRDEAGRIAFTRAGRAHGRGAWAPTVELRDGRNGGVVDVEAEVVIDLAGVTDPASGDRVLAVENLFEVERDPSGRPSHRWTGPGLSARISAPVASPRDGRLELTIVHPGPNALHEVEVSVDGEATRLTPDHPGWLDGSTVALPLRASPGGVASPVQIAVTAARTRSSGGDAREIGVAWSRARLIYPGLASELFPAPAPEPSARPSAS